MFGLNFVVFVGNVFVIKCYTLPLFELLCVLIISYYYNDRAIILLVREVCEGNL